MARKSLADHFHVSFPLERFGYNLSELARQDAFSPLEGCDAAVDRIFQVLARRNKNNPALLDDNETRRWNIVAEFLRRLVHGDIPANLSDSSEHFLNKQVIALDMKALFARPVVDTPANKEYFQRWQAIIVQRRPGIERELNEGWQILETEGYLTAELESSIGPVIAFERLRAVCMAALKEEGSAILFIDHLHRLVGGECDKYPIDAAPMLMPWLARGQLQMIGACTFEPYRRYIERDACLQRRFQEIVIPESYPQCEPTTPAQYRLLIENDT